MNVQIEVIHIMVAFCGEKGYNNIGKNLFPKTKTVEEKKRELENKFHICMESRLGEKVKLMCNLSDLVEEKGKIEGMLELLRDMGISLEDACKQVSLKMETTIDEVYEVAEKIWNV